MSVSEDRTLAALATIEQRANTVKIMVEELLMRVNRRDQIKWPEMLNTYTVIAAEISSITQIMRTTGVTNETCTLHNLTCTPQLLSLNADPDVVTATNGRIHAWNHNVPPDYLRTKPENSVIMNESAIVDTMSARTPDQINKQIAQINKHIDNFIQQLRDFSQTSDVKASQMRTTSRIEDTRAMQRALYRPLDYNMQQQQRQMQQQQQSTTQPMQQSAYSQQ